MLIAGYVYVKAQHPVEEKALPQTGARIKTKASWMQASWPENGMLIYAGLADPDGFF